MTPLIMASYKIFYLLFISCHVCYELYPFYQSEAASLPPTNHTASASLGKGGMSSETIVAIVVPTSVAVLVLIVGICCLSKRKRKKYDSESTIGISNLDSLQYDFNTIKAATNNFSADNKIGTGEVYKGTLANGQEIAVKRFFRSSGEDIEIFKKEVEIFKNEVEVLANVQHRNLVRLMGFCMQREEKILVYEYMPNKSLDYILSDPEKQKQLDWAKRFKIIKGIVQGIQYLHEDSRLKIIHFDLKAQNILLDRDMNPKITNFGLATVCAIDQTEIDVDCRGTVGYIAPEQFYRNLGKPSVKCDVYSFGFLLMKIISGKSDYVWYTTEDGEKYIMNSAWRLWKEGEPLELVDPIIRESCNLNEVMRCIHIALLCIQNHPADRPSMSSIIIMLHSYSLTLPSPSDPTGSIERERDELSTSSVESV